MSEVILVESVSLLESYLVHFIAEELDHHPEVLKTEPVTLTFEDLSSKDLIRRALRSFAYRMAKNSLKELVKTCHKMLPSGVEVTEELQNVTRARLIRNLIQHARGVVNQDFKDKYPDSGIKVGEKFEISPDLLIDLLSSVRLFARTLDYITPEVREQITKAALKEIEQRETDGKILIPMHDDATGEHSMIEIDDYRKKVAERGPRGGRK